MYFSIERMRLRYLSRKLFVCLCGIAALQSSHAQSTDPGQLVRELERTIELAQPPEPSYPPQPRVVRPTGLEGVSITLDQIEITGNTAIEAAELESLYADLLGTEVTLSQVYDVADKLTAEYRRRGFILSQAIVPAQEITEGKVLIQVVEGFIGEIDYKVQDFSSSAVVEGYGNQTLAQTPLVLSDFERSMLLINDLPGLSATSTIGRSETKGVGAAAVTVNSVLDKWSGYASVGNRGTKQLGPTRLDVSAKRNFVAGRHSAVGARGVFSLGDGELALVNGFVDMGLPSLSGSRLKLSVTGVSSTPFLDIAQFNDLESDFVSIALDYSKPLMRSRIENMYIDVGFQASDSSTLGQAVGEEFGTDTETKLRTLSVGIRADSVKHGNVVSQVAFKFKAGLDALGADDRRVQGDSPTLNYRKVEFSASGVQPISRRGSVLFGVNAQIGLSDSLPGSEAFGVGGQNFVRAYDGSEISADSGVAAKVELRYNSGALGGLLATPYIYYDAGKILDSGPRTSLSAAGLGVRMSRGDFGGYAEISVPLDGDVAIEQSDDARFFAGVSYSF